MDLRRITDFDAPELDVYARLTENQLLNRADPQNALFVAESPLVIGRALDAGCEPVSFLMETKHVTGKGAALLSRCPGVPVYAAEEDVLTNLTGFHLTRGMLCAMRRPPLADPAAVLRGATRVAVLENVMNPTNLGAIFRSAAALGMDAVLLTSAGSDPLYRRAIRVSMGTVFQVPWAYVPEDWPALLRAQGKEAKSADPAARAMSWMKTEAMLAMKPGDATTADLISTGCSMGIKSLARYCNQYPTASREAKDIAQSLIRLEDQLVKDMRPYL